MKFTTKLYFLIPFLILTHLSYGDNIQLSLDKGFYLSGETIQYNILLLNSSNDILEINRVFQCNFLDQEGQIIENKLIKTRNGAASGSFSVSSNLNSSYYIFEILEYSSGQQVLSTMIPVFNKSNYDHESLEKLADLPIIGIGKNKLEFNEYFIESSANIGDFKYKLLVEDEKGTVIDLELNKSNGKVNFTDKGLDFDFAKWTFEFSDSLKFSLLNFPKNEYFLNSKRLSVSESDFQLSFDEIKLQLRDYTDFNVNFNRVAKRSVLKWDVSIQNDFIVQKSDDFIDSSSKPFPTIFISADRDLSFDSNEDYMSIRGKLMDPNNNPLIQVSIGLIIDQENVLIRSDFTDTNGEFEFNQIDFYGQQLLRFIPVKKFVDFKPKIQLNNIYLETNFQAKSKTLSPDLTPSIAKALLFDSLKSIYIKEFETNELFLNESQGLSFKKDYDADLTYQLRDYKEFENFEELVNDLIPPLKVKEENGNITGFKLFSNTMQTTFGGSPSFIVDGFAIQSPEELLGLDVGLFEEIEIVSNPDQLFHLGTLASNGLIIIKTKKRIIQREGDILERKMMGYSYGSSLKVNKSALENKKHTPLIVNNLYYKSVVNSDKINTFKIHEVIPDNFQNLSVYITLINKELEQKNYRIPLSNFNR